MIPITSREMQKSWRDFTTKSGSIDGNANLLLKFYSIECGLKAVIMKRNNCQTTMDPTIKLIIEDCLHDINKLLDGLRAGSKLRLKNTKMSPLRNSRTPRSIKVSDLNQMWRYGGLPMGPVNNS